MKDVAQLTPAPSKEGAARWSPVALVVGMCLVLWLVGKPVAPPEGWGTDYSAAVASANAKKRLILIDFYTDGCPPCTAMDKFVLASDAVRGALQSFVPVRVDVDAERELANRFGVLGTPTFAVVGPEGELVSKCEGYQPVEQFVRFLKRASTLRSVSVSPTAQVLPDGH